MSTGAPTGRSTPSRRRPAAARATTMGTPAEAIAPALPPRAFPARRGSMRRAPFAALVVLVLGVGLVGQLLLNTSLAQGAFGLQDLRAQSNELAETQQTLEQQLARLQSPEQLAAKAQALGMVPSKNPVFIDLTDGGVEGVPVAATAPPPSPTATPTGTTTTPPATPDGQSAAPPATTSATGAAR